MPRLCPLLCWSAVPCPQVASFSMTVWIKDAPCFQAMGSSLTLYSGEKTVFLGVIRVV